MLYLTLEKIVEWSYDSLKTLWGEYTTLEKFGNDSMILEDIVWWPYDIGKIWDDPMILENIVG